MTRTMTTLMIRPFSGMLLQRHLSILKQVHTSFYSDSDSSSRLSSTGAPKLLLGRWCADVVHDIVCVNGATFKSDHSLVKKRSVVPYAVIDVNDSTVTCHYARCAAGNDVADNSRWCVKLVHEWWQINWPCGPLWSSSRSFVVLCGISYYLCIAVLQQYEGLAIYSTILQTAVTWFWCMMVLHTI